MNSVVGRGWALLFLLAFAPIAAQQPHERAALRLLRDSLAGATDTLRLHLLEQRTIEIARVQRDSAMLHLRLGFIAIRLGEVSGTNSHFDDAAGEFEWAASLRPDWPYPWYGLGLAESRLPDRARTAFGALQVMLGQDRDRLAGAAFARAVQLDPAFTEALADFAETVLDERINAPLAQAIDALRTATASRVGWDARLLLLLGRLERLAGNVDSARADFARSQLLAIRPAIPLFELARTLALTSDTTPRAAGSPNPVELAYYAAAESEEPEVVEMVRRDLSSIVSDSELIALDSLHGAARVEWLRRFWGERDQLDLRPAGSRLVEHYRRWYYAMQHFRLPPFRRRYRYGIELFQSRDADFDDRGVVWLRHGEPQKRIVWPQSMRQPDLVEPDWGDETWRYIRPDGDLVLHFAAHDDLGDYRLVESIFNLGVHQDELVARSRDLPGLNRMLHAGPNTARMLREEERLRSRKDLRVATNTDSWARFYPRPVRGRAEVSAVGAVAGGTLVHLVYSVDAAAVRRAAGDQATIPLALRAVFLDPDGHPVAALDTIERVHVPSAGSAPMVTVRAAVAVPSGGRRLRLGVELGPGAGALFPMDSVTVPRVTGPRLDLSSLVVGTSGRGLLWRATEQDSVWFDGTGVYAPEDTLVVYAEAYGVRPGAAHTVTLAIVRQQGVFSRFFSGRPPSVTLRDESRFSGAVGRYRRAVELRALAPGNYTVQLTIEGPNGKEVRRHGITIRPAVGGSGGG